MQHAMDGCSPHCSTEKKRRRERDATRCSAIGEHAERWVGLLVCLILVMVEAEIEEVEKEAELRSLREEKEKLSATAENATRRLLLLQKQLQEESNSGGGGAGQKSVFGTLLSSASGTTEEISRLRAEMDVLKEELEVKIKGNQMLHIEVFEEKEKHKSVVKYMEERVNSEIQRAKGFEEAAIARAAEAQVRGAENKELQVKVAEKEKALKRLGTDLVARERVGSGHFREVADLTRVSRQMKNRVRESDFFAFPSLWDSSPLKPPDEEGAAAQISPKMGNDQRRDRMDQQYFELNARSRQTADRIAHFEADLRVLNAFGRMCSAAECILGTARSSDAFYQKIAPSPPFSALFTTICSSLESLHEIADEYFHAPWRINDCKQAARAKVEEIANSFLQFSETFTVEQHHQHFQQQHILQQQQKALCDRIRQNLLDISGTTFNDKNLDSSSVLRCVDVISKLATLFKSLASSSNVSMAGTKQTTTSKQIEPSAAASKNPFAMTQKAANKNPFATTDDSADDATIAADNSESSAASSLSTLLHSDSIKHFANWIEVFSRALHEAVLVRGRQSEKKSETDVWGSQYLASINLKVKQAKSTKTTEIENLRNKVGELQRSLARAQKQLLEATLSEKTTSSKRAHYDEGQASEMHPRVFIDEEEEEATRNDTEPPYRMVVTNTRDGTQTDYLQLGEDELDLVQEMRLHFQNKESTMERKILELEARLSEMDSKNYDLLMELETAKQEVCFFFMSCLSFAKK